jgi:release factor glutamine methyltransferase
MYDSFFTAYQAFRNSKVEDPLLETLRLMDLLSNGAFRGLDCRYLERAEVDLPRIVRERQNGKPLEYTLGRSTFMGLSLFSSPAALIPRQETELLADTVLDEILEQENAGMSVTVIDVGTGSGNIAVSLAAYSRHTHVLATDISEEAISLAAKNVQKFGLEDRITLFCGDLFQPLAGQGFEGRVDVVVCNPPYIPTLSLGRLDPTITTHEPVMALDAGAYGIDFFRRLAGEAMPFLRPGGLLAFEIGAGQERIARRFVENGTGYENVRSVADAEGEVRVIYANRK